MAWLRIERTLNDSRSYAIARSSMVGMRNGTRRQGLHLLE